MCILTVQLTDARYEDFGMILSRLLIRCNRRLDRTEAEPADLRIRVGYIEVFHAPTLVTSCSC